MKELIIRIPEDADFGGLHDYYLINLGRDMLRDQLKVLGAPGCLEMQYGNHRERNY